MFCVWRYVAEVLCLEINGECFKISGGGCVLEISGGGSGFEDKWRMFSV